MAASTWWPLTGDTEFSDVIAPYLWASQNWINILLDTLLPNEATAESVADDGRKIRAWKDVWNQTTDEAMVNEFMPHHRMQCMQYVCVYVYTTTYNCVYKYVNYAYVCLSNVNVSLFVQKYYTTVCIIYIFVHTIVCVYACSRICVHTYILHTLHIIMWHWFLGQCFVCGLVIA